MTRTNLETPDELLVIEAILGSFDAFDELALRYRAAVVRTAQAVVGRDDAEDVAQDALLLAFKALPSIEDPTKFAAWLSAITRHRALRFNKRESAHKQGRIELDELLLEQLGALRPRPMIDERSSGDDDQEVRLALENIPADYALVLRLRFQDEMPLKRIAAFLGVTLSTAKWRVHRGKQLLREQIEVLRLRGETWKEIKSY
ncbi:MAG TPA: sigma-70 family RNA polymerase sigma factor [Pyrinomonadaceae bacterium]|nr:sigma-70 family RNA polymerase sigma factor [Pyrinomonadaceae bacterium]